jgi:anion-transporting  ArsA/GET3 family ATPase
MLRQVSSVVGSRIVEDGEAFLRAFQGMEDGFRQRAKQVTGLIGDSGTTVLLVTTPRRESVEETRWFAEQVLARGIRIGGLVINRTHPSFSDRPVAELTELSDLHADGPLGAAFGALVDAQTTVEAERNAVAELAALVAPAPVVEIPLLPYDVRDLEGIETIARHLG